MALQTTCSRSQANQSHHLGPGVDSLPLNTQAVTMVSKANLKLKFTCKSDACIQASGAHKLSLLSLIEDSMLAHTHTVLLHIICQKTKQERALFYCLTYEKPMQTIQGWFISPDSGPFCSLISCSCFQKGGLPNLLLLGRKKQRTLSFFLHISQTYF